MASEIEGGQKRKRSLASWFHLVRFSHTLFALPFACVGFTMAIAAGYTFSWDLLVKMLLCMVFARTAAMAFNRVVDRKIDAANPRTAQREIPAGIISVGAARQLVVACCLLFIGTCAFINNLVLILSPVALAVVLGYSYLKRITSLCHFGIGLALSLAPIGGYLCLSGEFAWPPVLLGVGVFLWVAGFDIIYALQDVEQDRLQGLHSLPSALGIKRALTVAWICSLLSAVALCGAPLMYSTSLFDVLGEGLFFGIMLVQLLSVKSNDLSRLTPSYMLVNGIGSLIYGVLVSVGLVSLL